MWRLTQRGRPVSGEKGYIDPQAFRVVLVKTSTYHN
jgi:hypothetical protein